MADENLTPEPIDWSDFFQAMVKKTEDDRVAAANRDANTLLERARELAAPVETETGPGAAQYTLFTIGEEKYALSAAVVEEVLSLPHVTPLPRAPGAVVGFFSRRGSVYLALDARVLVKVASSAEPAYLITLLAPIPRIALRVDLVLETREIPDAAIKKTDVGASVAAGVTPDKFIVLDALALWKIIGRELDLEQ